MRFSERLRLSRGAQYDRTRCERATFVPAGDRCDDAGKTSQLPIGFGSSAENPVERMHTKLPKEETFLSSPRRV